ncbi:hypothetical protein LTR94_036044, partial [Friedmanniomyces endolithicus]
MAQRLIDGDVGLARAAGHVAEQHLADLRDDVIVGNETGIARDEEFGGGIPRGSGAVRDVAAFGDEGAVYLHRPWAARSDEVD